MLRSLLWLFRSHIIRLTGMGLIFAVVVFMITLLNQIIINIDNQIANETKPIVWADMIVSSAKPFSWEFLDYIVSLEKGYKFWKLLWVQFYTTVWQWKDPKLVQVKWVQNGYPRYGDLLISALDADYEKSWSISVSDITNLTWVVLDTQTYEIIGKSKNIVLWKLTLPVLWVITKQASLWFNFLDEGRTILMPYELVKQTELTDIWSRVQYQILIKLQNDDQWPLIKKTIEWVYKKTYDISLASQRVNQLQWLVDQLNQYTSIIIIITVLLSLVIMTIANSTMTLQIKQAIGIMRVLGLTKLKIMVLCILLFWSVFVFGLLLWTGISYYIFQIIRSLPLAEWFIRYSSTVWLSIGVWVISCIISSRSSLRFLVDTDPLLLLKSSEMNLSSNDKVISWLLMVVWVWSILFLLTQALLFSFLAMILWLILWILIHYGIRYLFRSLTLFYNSRRKKNFLRFDAVRETILPGNQTSLLVWWLFASLLSFCVITAVSFSFIDRLRISSLDQPNVFVLNVRNADIQTIEKIDTGAILYDTILWRIWSINGVLLSDYLKSVWKADSREFTREFNTTTRLLKNSPIIKGIPVQSWSMSLDENFAKDLWLKIWDIVWFYIQWRTFDLKITSFRKRISTGTEPFFYIQLDVTQFEQAPRSWFRITRKTDLSSFKKLALDKVGPHLSFVDIEAIITLVSDVSTRILAVVFACMILIILLVLCVSIVSNESSALLSKNSYRLYYMLWMKKSDLMSKSLRIVMLYIAIIWIALCIFAPICLYMIFANASLLVWSWSSLRVLGGGVIIVLMVLLLSYRGFHRRIVKSV